MLPSEIVKQVRRIQFQTGRHVADVLAGQYLSVFKGHGIEFEEVRPYVPGDDVRTIDWNVTARTGTPYVKRYTEERERTVLLLVDISASQDFGSAARSKRQAAVELSALVALSAIHNDDKVGLLLFRGQVEGFIPPRKGQQHALRVVREVLARGVGDEPGEQAAAVPRTLLGPLRRLRQRLRGVRRGGGPGAGGAPARGTHIAAALELCRKVLPRRAVLFLISDFLDEGYLPALRTANRRHDVIAVLVTDEREQRIAGGGLLRLLDAETGQARLLDASAPGLQRAVAEAAAGRLAALRATLQSSGVDLLHIDAARPVVDPLLAFFRMRQRRRRR